jgi:hypothetical protein
MRSEMNARHPNERRVKYIFAVCGILVVLFLAWLILHDDPRAGQALAVPTQPKISQAPVPPESHKESPSVVFSPVSSPSPKSDIVPRQQPGETRSIIGSRAWKNAGRATPAAALETHYWSVRNGDTAAVAAGIKVAPSAQEALTELVALLPSSAREKFLSPEEALAFLMCGTSDATGFFISYEERHGDTSKLCVTSRHPDGSGKLHSSIKLFERQADGSWKMLIYPRVVQDYKRYIQNRPPR